METNASTLITNYREFLERYVRFTDEEWSIFSNYFKIKTLKKKAFVAEEGKICTEVGFITTGSVRIYRIKDGQEITGYFCFDQELVSSYKSFVTQTPSNCYIQTMADTQMVVYSKKALEELQENTAINYKIERMGRLIAEELLCCYDDRVSAFVTQSPEERYLQLLAYGRHIIKRIPQHYIANYLGITPVSLSRIRKRIMEPAMLLVK